MRADGLLTSFIIVGALWACDDAPVRTPVASTSDCVPGVSRACVCPSGVSATQTCGSDARWGLCQPCTTRPGDGGNPIDTGPSPDTGAPQPDAATEDSGTGGQDGALAVDAADHQDASLRSDGASADADGGTSIAVDSGAPPDADGGPTASDAGGITSDSGTGPPDAFLPTDAGTPVDSGGRIDAGPFDAGTPPAGPCPAHWPGCRCTPSGMPPSQGSCVDPTNICAELSTTLAVCHRECVLDTDCAGLSIAGNRPAPLCLDGVCVEVERKDDESCRLHALGGRQLAGCRPGASCIAIGGAVPPGEGTCLQFCTPTPLDPTGGCPLDLPYCNPNVLNNAGTNIGVCSAAALNAGARCRGGDTFTRRCNSDPAAGRLFCLSNDIVDIWRSLPQDEGFCIEDCDPAAPSCAGTRDPALGPGRCINLGTGAGGQAVGLCSNGCSELPNNCSGPGLGAGARCLETSLRVGTSTGGTIGLCTDVQTPTIAEAPIANVNNRPALPAGATADDCYGGGRDGTALRCEHDTMCFETLGTPALPVAGCVRMCTRTATAAPYDANECASSLRFPGAVCVPLSTTSPGIDVGFCTTLP